MRRSARAVRAPGLVLGLLFLTVATPVVAQTWARRDVRGTAVDAGTGQPIAGAWVGIADGDGVFTDEEGRFVLRRVRIGTVAIEAAQLGYTDFAEERVIGEGDETLRIELEPDPVVLEGIRVVTDRLAARRNAVPYSVRAYDASRILSGPASDAYEFVRLNAFTRPCGFSTCIYRRGRLERPAVFIDESPYLGGLDDLRGLPVEHLYLIEVIGSQVRVYTKTFAERLATRSTPLMPMLVHAW